MKRWWVVAPVVVAGFLGCVPGGDDDDSGGNASAQDVVTALMKVYNATCDYDGRCADTRGHRWVSVEECKIPLDGPEAARWLKAIGPYLEQAGSRLEGSVNPCLEAINGLACDDAAGAYGGFYAAYYRALGAALPEGFGLPVCSAAFSADHAPTQNPLGEGQACGNNNEGSCGTGLYCDWNLPTGCEVCKARAANGTACTGDSYCLSSSCQDGFCAAALEPGPPVPKGSACSESQPCLGYLRCEGTPGATTCQDSWVGENSPCQRTESRCQAPLECTASADVGTCLRKLADGQACTRNGSHHCQNACVFDAVDATEGHCAPEPTPANGGPCYEDYSGYSNCGEDQYSESVSHSGDTTSCTCHTRQADGAACTNGNACTSYHCVEGHCGALHGAGGSCRSGSDCETEICGLGAAAGTGVCRAPQCSVPTPGACNATPGNTDVEHAVSLSMDQLQSLALCTVDTEYFWRLAGGFPAGTTLALGAERTRDDGYVSLELGTLRSGSFSYLGSAYVYSVGGSWTYVVLSSEATDLLVRAQVHGSGSGSFAAEEVSVVFKTLPSGGGVCSSLPGNSSAAAAQPVSLDQVVQGEVCSQSADTEYYWKVDGSFQPGDLLRLQNLGSTPLAGNLGSNAGSLELGQVDPDGSFTSLATAYGSDSSPRVGVVKTASTAVYVRTSLNPSAMVHAQVSFQVSRTTDAGATCPNPPTNTTMATALPMQLGQDMTGRFCSLAADLEYWWKIDGSFPAMERYKLEVTFQGADPDDVDFYLQSSTGTGEPSYLASCYSSGNESCEGTLWSAATTLYVITSSNPSSDKDESFTLRVTKVVQ